MDYFNELLESYSQLKKRTFKLKYISEQESEIQGGGLDAKLGSTLLQILGSAPPLVNGPDGKPKGSDFAPFDNETLTQFPGLSKFNFKRTAAGGVAVRSGNNQATVIDANNTLLQKKSALDKWNSMLAAMSGDAKEDVENTVQATEEEAKKNTAGAVLLEKYPSLQGDASVESALVDIQKNFDKLCAPLKGKSSQNVSKALKGFCTLSTGRANAKRIGELEKFLTNVTTGGKGIKLVKREGDIAFKKGEGSEVNESLIAECLESFKLLSDVLDPDSDVDCQALSSRIGFVPSKDNDKEVRVILYDANGESGITNSTTNNMFKLLKGHAESRCEAADLSNKYLIGLNSHNRGILHERLFSVGHLVLAGDKKGALKIIKEELDKAEEIVHFMSQSSLLVEDSMYLTEAEEFLENFKTTPKAKAYLRKELTTIIPFLTKYGIQTVFHVGGQLDQGDRADNIFGWKDKKKALAFAKAFGISSDSLGQRDNFFTFGVGHKRKTDNKAGVDLGKTSSLERSVELMTATGDKVSKLKDVHESFLTNIDKSLGLGTERAQEVADYYENTVNEVKELLTPILKPGGSYITQTGKIKANPRPAQIAKKLSELLGNKLSKKQQKIIDSDLKGVLDTVAKMGKEGKNERSISVLADSLTRRFQMSKLLQDSKTNNTAKAALLKLGSISGMNTKDIVQVLVTDEGKLKAWNHNEIFKRVNKAFQEDPDSVNIEMYGSSSANLKIGLGDDVNYSLQASRQWRDDNKTEATTKFITKSSDASIDALSSSNSKLQSESTIREYVDAQVKLLTELLSN